MAKNQTFNISLKLLSTQFEKGINKVKTQLKSFGNYIKSAFAVTSLTAFTKAIANIGGQFEDQMARVMAVSNASAEEFKNMKDAALKIGKTTRYSAIEAGKGLELLTRNGLKAEQAINVLAPSLDLAAANAIDLGSAADMVTNVLNMFNKNTSHAAEVADLLSTAAANSATDVNSLYEAFVNAGPTAASLGLSIEETTAALMTLANQGIKGADAGSKLAQAFSKLLNPQVQKDLAQYGIEIDAATIKSEGLIGVLQKFKQANLGPETMVEVFGERAWRGINTLVKEVDAYERNIGTAGTATGTASRMAEQGIGDWELAVKEFKNTWQDAMIKTFANTEGVLIGAMNAAKNFITFLSTGWGAAAVAANVFFVTIARGFQKSNALQKQYEATLMAMDAVLDAAEFAQAGLNAEVAINAKHVKYAVIELEKYVAEMGNLGKTSVFAAESLKLLQTIDAKLRSNIPLTKKEVEQLNITIDTAKRKAREAGIALETLSTTTGKLAKVGAGLKKIGKGIYTFFGGWIGIVMTLATVIASQLIPRLNKTKKAITELNEKFGEAEGEINKLTSSATNLINSIGSTSGLNGVIKKACMLFPEFEDKIKAVGKAAAETGDLKEFKKLLENIVNGINVKNEDDLNATIEKTIELFPEFQKQLKKAHNEAKQTGNYTKLKKAINEIFAGFDKRELNTQIREAIKLFPEFRTQIEQAAAAANDIKGYNNLKSVLTDILNLQTKMMGVKAATEQYEGYTDILAEKMMNSSNKNKKKAGLLDLSEYFDKNDTPKSLQKSIYKTLADMYVRGMGSDKINDYVKTVTAGKVEMPGGWNANMIEDAYKEVAKAREYLKVLKDYNDELNRAETKLEIDSPIKDKVNDINEDEIKKVQEAKDKFEKEISSIGKKSAAGRYADENEELKDLIKAYNTYIDAIAELDSVTAKQIENIANTTSNYRGEALTLAQLEQKLKDVTEAEKAADEAKKKREAADSLEKQLVKDTPGYVSSNNSLMGNGPAQIEIQTGNNKMPSLSRKDNKSDLGVQSIENAKDKLKELVAEYNRLSSMQEEIQNRIQNNPALKQEGEEWDNLTDAAKECYKTQLESDQQVLDYFNAIPAEIKKAEKELNKLETTYNELELKQAVWAGRWTALDDSVSLIGNVSSGISNLADQFDRLEDSERPVLDTLSAIISTIQLFSSTAHSITSIIDLFGGLSDTVNAYKSAQAAAALVQDAANKKAVAGEIEKQGAALMTTTTIAGQGVAALAAAGAKETADAGMVAGEGAKQVAAATTTGGFLTQAVAGILASNSAIPLIGLALGIAGVGALLGFFAAKTAGFSSGGIVSGMKHGDKNLVRVNGGEMILNTQEQSRLFNILNGRGSNGGNSVGQVEFKISGKELKGVLNNYNAANSKITSTL